MLGGTQFSDKRPILFEQETMMLNAHNLFTPSEKNKINVLDAMDQEMIMMTLLHYLVKTSKKRKNIKKQKQGCGVFRQSTYTNSK